MQYTVYYCNVQLRVAGSNPACFIVLCLQARYIISVASLHPGVQLLHVRLIVIQHTVRTAAALKGISLWTIYSLQLSRCNIFVKLFETYHQYKALFQNKLLFWSAPNSYLFHIMFTQGFPTGITVAKQQLPGLCTVKWAHFGRFPAYLFIMECPVCP